MIYEPPSKDGEKPKDKNADSEMDRLREYSRQFEGEFNQGEIYEDEDNSADWWKKG